MKSETLDKKTLLPHLLSLGYENYKQLHTDYSTNFLTVGGFASHHDIDYNVALALIKNAYSYGF